MDRISTDDVTRRRRTTSQTPHRARAAGSDEFHTHPVRKKNPQGSSSRGKTSSQKRSGRGNTSYARSNNNGKSNSSSLTLDNWQDLPKRALNGVKNGLHNVVAVATNKRLACDKPLVFIVMALLLIGLIMMYSASYAYAYYELQDSAYYIKRQMFFAAAGIVAMYFMSTRPVEKYKKKWPGALLIASYVLLGIVFLMPRINGVKRWIVLGGFTFQPSEIAKFAVILWSSYYLAENYKKINTVEYDNDDIKLRAHHNKFSKWCYEMCYNFKVAIFPFISAFAVLLAMVLLEPHLSCTVLMVLIIATMMYVGGTKKEYFVALFALGIVAFGLIIYTDIVPYGQDRIRVWLDPFTDKLGDGWQNIQSLYAISSGGLFGVGLGNSRQKYLYISEPQNDFIFAVVCEELGLVGATIVILLFALFVWRGFSISMANPDKFARFIGIGITSQIGFQALLNICVVTKIVPNTGISLPFFSSGGTSLLMLLAEIGVLLAISRSSPNKII